MASCNRKLPTLAAAFFCIALLLSATEIERVEAIPGCGVLSASFKGPCILNSNCDQHCKSNEKALGGVCILFACYCKYNNCNDHP